MKNPQKIIDWFDSGEYRTTIATILTNIVRKSEMSNSEATTSAAFENELYYHIRRHTGIDPKMTKEEKVDGIVHNFGDLTSRTSGHGRLDAVINQLIIEYKHHTKLKNDHQIQTAYQQVIDYLISLRSKYGVCYDAILTDGLRIAYFSFVGEEVCSTTLRALQVEDIDRIIHAILNNNTKKFEPVNITTDFAISNVSDSDTRNIARIFFNWLSYTPCDKTLMLYSEWMSLMHLSLDDNGKSQDIEKRRKDLSAIFDVDVSTPEKEYKALFALQTTYSVIVKLIACKVIDKINYGADTRNYHDLTSLSSERMRAFFHSMENGYAYTNMGIHNFLEGDFFSWYADENQWDETFWKAIIPIIISIDEYSVFTLSVRYTPVDVFKDLYMSIIPQSVRHSMGEYFTPEWLADGVIREGLCKIDNENWRAIDPCCGSGIFIITLIRNIVGDICLHDLNQDQKQRIISNITERVYGIDINPLSVLSARVSYYMAIRQIGTIQNIEIPIYLGDSAILPKKIIIDDVPCYYYSIDNNNCNSIEVILPERLVNDGSFGKQMYDLQTMVEAESVESLETMLFSELTEVELASQTLIEHIHTLAKSLVYLHKNQWDGIWVRIATNFMLIARLRPCDLIVGNPPWVKWEHLPADYSRKIREFCDVRHIFCQDNRGMFGGTQLNICALISNVVATNWLSPSGVLAFLMPDSLMSQNSYEEYRNFYIDYDNKIRLYLQQIDRWQAPLRPFRVGNKAVSQDFNTYYFGYDEVNYSDVGVPVRTITREKGYTDNLLNKCGSFAEASKHLLISNNCAKQLSEGSTAFTYLGEFDFSLILGTPQYVARTGVESTPFEIFKMIGVGNSTIDGHYRFKNDSRKTSKYKVEDVPDSGWDFPTELLYPMVEGPCISPFRNNWDNKYHIVPYTAENTATPIPLEQMLLHNREVAIYFTQHRTLIDQQSEKSKAMHRGDAFYALSKIGAYTFAPHIVAVRDNSNFCSCVVQPTNTPWGELKQSICVKHTMIISTDTTGRMITEDEAYYINGILNSDIVHQYVHSTYKTNGFPLIAKMRINIPLFDETNDIHCAIRDLSKEATTNRECNIDIAMRTLGQLYLRLCQQCH